MANILEVKKVGKKFQNKDGEVQAIKDVNFSVSAGEFVSIIGPSRMWKINITFSCSRFGKQKRRRNIHRR